MTIVILLWISIAALAVMIGMLLWQVHAIRQGWADHTTGESLSAALQPKLDHAAFHFSTFAGAITRRVSVAILTGLRAALIVFKDLLIKVEKRFARIINAVKGKGSISKKGSVSLYWQEVEQYRLEVRSAGEVEEG